MDTSNRPTGPKTPSDRLPHTEVTSAPDISPLDRTRPLALVLKGGGVKGLAYAGALAELAQHFRFEIFVGTSAGAITAVLLAAGYDAQEVLEISRNTNFTDFLDPVWRWPFNIVRYGALNSGRPLESWLKALLDCSPSAHKAGDVEMQHLVFRGIVYASSSRAPTMRYDRNGERCDAPAAFAARCSASVPWFFAAESEHGRPIVDGGLRNNFPLDDFVRLNGSNFVALYLRSPESRSYMAQLSAIVMNERLETELVQRFEDRTIPIDAAPIGMLEFALTDESKELLILRGRAAAKTFLAVRFPELVTRGDVERADERATEMAAVVSRQRNRRRVGVALRVAAVAAAFVGMFVVPWRQLYSPLRNPGAPVAAALKGDVGSKPDVPAPPSPNKPPLFDPEPDRLVDGPRERDRTLELAPTFLVNYEDRATIIAERFIVDKVSRLHAPRNDGDLDFVGRTPFIKLITRAELMNGAMHRELASFLNDVADSKSEITVVGAWRIWFERTQGAQRQGGPESLPDSSNPSHFFELHPVVRINATDLSDTLTPIVGYDPYPAERAFPKYEELRCTIATDHESGRRRISISKAIGYNYASFTFKATQGPVSLKDGHSVIGSVQDGNRHTLVESLRVISVRDTPPDGAVARLAPGDELGLIGIPRLSLKAIRAGHDGEIKLPYEMIAAAVLR